MHPKGLHSKIEFEFPIADTFTYETNKANIYTKNKNPTPTGQKLQGGGHYDPITSSPLKILSVTQGSLTPDQRLSPEDVLSCPIVVPQPASIKPRSGPESGFPKTLPS